MVLTTAEDRPAILSRQGTLRLLGNGRSIDPMHGDQGAPRARTAYLPGLDGLRAISVVAVLLYHADMRVAAGRFPRRRGLLRHQRLPDHAAAQPGVHPPPRHRPRAVLAAPGPPPARRPVHPARRRLGRRPRLLPRGRRRAGRPGLGRAHLRHELVPHRHRPVVLRHGRATDGVPTPVVTGDRGAVLPGVAGAPARAVARQPRTPVGGGDRRHGRRRSPHWCGWRCCSSRRWTRAASTTAPTPAPSGLLLGAGPRAGVEADPHLASRRRGAGRSPSTSPGWRPSACSSPASP